MHTRNGHSQLRRLGRMWGPVLYVTSTTDIPAIVLVCLVRRRWVGSTSSVVVWMVRSVVVTSGSTHTAVTNVVKVRTTWGVVVVMALETPLILAVMRRCATAVAATSTFFKSKSLGRARDRLGARGMLARPGLLLMAVVLGGASSMRLACNGGCVRIPRHPTCAR